MNESDPYLLVAVIEKKYNPNYGNERICECGHPYHRHFDSYDEMYPIGCKYCECIDFIEDKGLNMDLHNNILSHINNTTPFPELDHGELNENTTTHASFNSTIGKVGKT